MKTTLLLLTLLTCLCLNLRAQTYFSITDSGSVWRYETQWGGQPYDHIFLELSSIKEDTFFNDHIYSKLEVLNQTITCIQISPYEDWETSSVYSTAFFIREDSMKRTYIANGLGWEELFYDFNLNTGDSLPISYINPGNDNYVFSIDSILIGSEYRIRYNINSFDHPDPYASIIEGIGSTYGLLYPLWPPFETYNKLICYTDIYSSTQFADPLLTINNNDDDMDDCNLIYVDINSPKSVEENINIFPNPISNIFSLQYSGNIHGAGKIKILNINSQVVFENAIQIYPNVKITADITNIPDGIYLLILETENINYSSKIIKQ
ncbi:MAG: T9SS type A sorting domain-containing protein [Bacteroidetes bacterium]|jgi:hypothetical protein|nr:T9SS type A sorting domain-containing protein [Bacteroidota bacterium]MBK7569450.1 T9SS type A sorting domain-containing protein [Bacteroidota bacterium]